MSGRKSKTKGNSFELKVSKLLSVKLDPLNFIRVPGSGARDDGLPIKLALLDDALTVVDWWRMP